VTVAFLKQKPVLMAGKFVQIARNRGCQQIQFCS